MKTEAKEKSNVLPFVRDESVQQDNYLQDFCEVYLIVDHEETRQAIQACAPVGYKLY